MDITTVATSTSSMEHNEHDKNGTGDDDGGDTAQQQNSVHPCQLQQLYTVYSGMVQERPGTASMTEHAYMPRAQRHPTHILSNSNTEA